MLSSISPPPHLIPVINSCKPQGDYIAVHVRAESDWYPDYCKKLQNMCYTPLQIAKALLVSLPALANTKVVLLYGNLMEESFPLGSGGHPLEVFSQMLPNISIFHKSNSQECISALSSLSFNEQAYIDLSVAAQALRFLGTLESTFSRSVFEMRKGQLRNRANNYAWNCRFVAPLIKIESSIWLKIKRWGAVRQRCSQAQT